MRLVSVLNCTPGMIIEKEIYNETGNILLAKGVSLTKRMIDSLWTKGIPFIYIKDKLTEDIVIEDDISVEVRQTAEQTIRSKFMELQNGQHGFSRSVLNYKMVDEFKSLFKSLVSEMKNIKSSMNFLTHIQAKDNYLFSHSLNVTLYTLAIAMRMGLNQKQLTEIGIGSLLHDVGKLFVPKEILNKSGKLTEEEFSEMKKHTEYGFELLRKQFEIPLPSAHCAFQHHEKMNGMGYPRGLKGEDIHPYARILAVGDVFDALTTERVYRKPMLPHEAMELIYADTFTHFDSTPVESFRNAIFIYPLGLTVILNTGETGVIFAQNQTLPSRPLVRIIKDEKGEDLTSWKQIDLAKELHYTITQCDAIM